MKTTNTSRITIPSGGDGLWSFGAQAVFDIPGAAGGDARGIRIVMNGTKILAYDRVNEIGFDGEITPVATITPPVAVVAGDYVEVFVQQGTQANLDVLATIDGTDDRGGSTFLFGYRRAS